MAEQSDLSKIDEKARAQNLVRVIEDFVRQLNSRAGETHAAEVIQDNYPLDGAKIGQQPERFIAEELIDPISSVLGYEFRYEPKGFDGLGGRIPDFTALNLDATNLGEIKKPGGIRDARKESVEYLNMAESRPLVGIATDGFVWILHTAAEEDDRPTYTRHATINKLVRKVRMLETTSAEGNRHPYLRELSRKFVTEFNIDSVRSTVQ